MPVVRKKKTNSVSTTVVASPHDIVLPNNWKLGRLLGEGAQGSVYAVVEAATGVQNDEEETPWAVKIAVNPTTTNNKSTKGSKTTSPAAMTARVNALSLRNEGNLYKAHLKALRGTIVPNTPDDDDLAQYQGVQESSGMSYATCCCLCCG